MLLNAHRRLERFVERRELCNEGGLSAVSGVLALEEAHKGAEQGGATGTMERDTRAEGEERRGRGRRGEGQAREG